MKSWIFGAVAFIVVIAITAYLGNRIIHTTKMRMANLKERSASLKGAALLQAHDAFTKDTVVSVVKIAYSHVQVLALLLGIDFDWHSSVDRAWDLASSITVTSSSVTTAVICIFDHMEDSIPAFYKKTLLVYSLPVLVGVALAVLWSFLFMTGRCGLVKRMDYYYGWELTFVIFLFCAHIALTLTAIELFVCTSSKVQDRTFLVADPRVECFAGDYIYWFIFAGLGGLVVYGAGIPFLAARRLSRGHNFYLYAFLCKSFKHKYAYWESAVAIRKVAVVVFVTTLERFGPGAQGLSAVIVLYTALLVQVVCQPYDFPFLNQLETTGIIVLIITATSGSYSLSFESNADIGFNIIVFLANAVFVLFIVYELLFISCGVCFQSEKIKQGKRHSSYASSKYSTASRTKSINMEDAIETVESRAEGTEHVVVLDLPTGSAKSSFAVDTDAHSDDDAASNSSNQESQGSCSSSANDLTVA
jgi:hypothetical protein